MTLSQKYIRKFHLVIGLFHGVQYPRCMLWCIVFFHIHSVHILGHIYFEKRIPRRVQRLLAHQRFRAAYDFLLLRAVTEGGPVQALAQWWSAFLEADEDKRVELLKKVAAPNSKRKRRSPKKPKPKVDSTSHGEDR